MDLAQVYKRTHKAGSWSLWFGVVQLALIPLVVWVMYADQSLNDDEKLLASIIGGGVQLVFGGLLIFFGLKLRSASEADPASLAKARMTINVLIGVVVVGFLVGLLGGAKIGMLMILVLRQLMLARTAVKASGTPGAPAAVAAPAAPVMPADAPAVAPAAPTPAPAPVTPAPAAPVVPAPAQPTEPAAAPPATPPAF